MSAAPKTVAERLDEFEQWLMNLEARVEEAETALGAALREVRHIGRNATVGAAIGAALADTLFRLLQQAG